MTAIAARLGRRAVSPDGVAVAAGALVLALIVARGLHVQEIPALQTFVLVLVSIVIEALPFMLVGALVSAALAVLVSERLFERVARLPLGIQLPGAALGAFAFPVCECGSVPVARRLIARGLHPAASLTFMFAAPILNPLVLGSTWVAYGGGRRGAEMVAARAAVGLCASVTAGVALGRRGVLREPRSDGQHEHADLGRFDEFAGHVTRDFLYMGRFIVLGAALSALLQSVVPQSAVSAVATTPVVAELALMAVAFALSLCSEADAFVAASFGAFGAGPQLAFLVSGPIVDAKLSALYGATFRRQFVVRLVLVAAPVIVAGSMLAGSLVR